MHKIGDDTPTANGADEFQESPAATDLRSTTLNTWQRELVKIVEGAGLVLDGSNDEQIWSVLKNAVQFFPHGEAVPSMKVVIEAGRIWSGQNYINQAQQITALIVAPTVDPRIDLIAVDITTGLYTVIEGAEAAVPVAPNYGENHFPVCQFKLETTTTTITLDAQSAINSKIINERPAVHDNEGPDVTGFVKGLVHYVEEQTGGHATEFDADAVIAEEWESIGPTGSGATNIWTAMDNLPATTKFIDLFCYLLGNASGVSVIASVFARKAGDTTGLLNRSLLAGVSMVSAGSGATTSQMAAPNHKLVPVDSSLRFDLVLNGSVTTAHLTLLGVAA